MAPNPRRQRERLEEVYAELPKIKCKGLCSDSCTAIDMSIREREDIKRASGTDCRVGTDGFCNKLVDGRCSVYDLRPMICRMWGVVESMPCPHGCIPEGGLMPDDEAFPLLTRTLEAGGRPASFSKVSEDLVRVALADENTRRALIGHARQGWDSRMRQRFG